MADIKCFDASGDKIIRLFQWDSNRQLIFTGLNTSPLPTFSFTNLNTPSPVFVTPVISGDTLVVPIPNELLYTASPLKIHIGTSIGDGAYRTVRCFYLRVTPRVYTDDRIAGGE
jgi:hypothetical protein